MKTVPAMLTVLTAGAALAAGLAWAAAPPPDTAEPGVPAGGAPRGEGPPRWVPVGLAALGLIALAGLLWWADLITRYRREEDPEKGRGRRGGGGGR